MLDISTLFSRIWFQTDMSQSYEIVKTSVWMPSIPLFRRPQPSQAQICFTVRSLLYTVSTTTWLIPGD
jgi:hypothetical protein